jgi:hypothetical protein
MMCVVKLLFRRPLGRAKTNRLFDSTDNDNLMPALRSVCWMYGFPPQEAPGRKPRLPAAVFVYCSVPLATRAVTKRATSTDTAI